MGRLIDLTGKRFGKLVVLERAENRGRHVYWKCQCDCGAIRDARAEGLMNGQTISCGHCDFEDLTGKQFGRRTVIGRAPDRFSADGYPIRYWTCKCECGSVNEISETRLTHGKAQSCGCLTKDRMRAEKTTHNQTGTRLYNIWSNMKARTSNPNDQAWKDYGGRGITICEEWKRSFEAFYSWAYKNGYNDELTIDRIDVNGNYRPDNCRWVPMEVQARNKRNTIKITFNGQTLTCHDWSKIVDIPEETIKSRYHDGMSPEKILTKPYKKTLTPVISIDDNGNKKYYDSITNAAKAVGVAGSSISAVLRHKHKTAAGFKWIYDTEVLQKEA